MSPRAEKGLHPLFDSLSFESRGPECGRLIIAGNYCGSANYCGRGYVITGAGILLRLLSQKDCIEILKSKLESTNWDDIKN